MQRNLSLQQVQRRSELEQQIVTLLRGDPRVAQVRPYGSIAEGRADWYSDIDLVVHVNGVSDRAFAETLQDLIQPIGWWMVGVLGFFRTRISARSTSVTIHSSGMSILAA